jgi:hypothetical protein
MVRQPSTPRRQGYRYRHSPPVAAIFADLALKSGGFAISCDDREVRIVW